MLDNMAGIFVSILKWIGTWFYFVSLICFFGAVLGGLSHTLFGLFFIKTPDYNYLVAFGFSNGLRYGGVWAGGASIVLCVLRARKKFLERQAVESRSTKLA